MHRFLKSDKLYLDEEISKKDLDKLKQQILVSPRKAKAFLICLSSSPNSQIEIIESKYLKQAYYERNPLIICGVAGKMQSAKELLLKMMQDALDSSGQADMKGYLSSFLEE